MKTRVCVRAAFGLSVFFLVRPALGFDVSLQVDAGTPLTISDNDVSDLNPAVGIIDFDVTATPVDGALAARGRLIQDIGTIGRAIELMPIDPDPRAVLQNVDVASHAFKVTINSSTYPTTGPPPRLGWTLIYQATAEDPTPDDVEIPSNSVQLSVTMSDSTPTILSTLSAAVPLTPPAGQPVTVSVEDLSSDPTGTIDAVSSHVILSFAPGPGDGVFVGTTGTLFANVFDEAEKCIDKMNNGARVIVTRAGTGDAKCVKKAAKSGGSATACIDDPADTLSADEKVLGLFALRCSPLPAWGVNGGTCSAVPGDCITAAAELAVNQLTHDILGATAVVGIDQVGACQANVVKTAGKVLADRWKAFRLCKKKNIDSIADDASLVTTCLGPPQPDPGLKLSKSEAKLDKVVNQCIGHGVTPIGPSFAGLCTGAADGAFAGCVEARIRCRFCFGVNGADDISPPLDCDLFDDGSANSSCP